MVLLMLLLFGGNCSRDSGSRGRGGYGRVVGVVTVHHGLLRWRRLWLRLWLLLRLLLLWVMVERLL